MDLYKKLKQKITEEFDTETDDDGASSHVTGECQTSIRSLYTWAYLPYMEVLKSGHRTADLGSLNHTFFCGLKLPTLAV